MEDRYISSFWQLATLLNSPGSRQPSKRGRKINFTRGAPINKAQQPKDT